MGPENPPQSPEFETQTAAQQAPATDASSTTGSPLPEPPYRGLRWIFIGEDGLRSGWSVTIFVGLFVLFGSGINYLIKLAHLDPPRGNFTPRIAFFGEFLQVLLLLLLVWIVSLIERRKLLDYNLRGPRRLARFGSGMVTGFLALSLLVAGLSAGGWLHFGPIALSGSRIVLYAGEWGAVFLLVGCFEEGLARCYLLFTLTRGLNFWWAVGLVACICALVSLNPKASGLWGAYAIALVGLAPCLILQLQKAPGTGFWNAAWATSVMFGAAHTSNNGENWIGIFAAAGIGFVFCASVRLTGSAWWAIGCHAAWDWGETYFYGTADSGFVAKGHLLTTAPTGNVLWSGGADGPEGSLLTIPIMLLIVLALVVQYGRKRQGSQPAAAAEQPAAG